MPKIFIKWKDIVGGMCDDIWEYNIEAHFEDGKPAADFNEEYFRGQVELLRDTAFRYVELSDKFDGSDMVQMLFDTFIASKEAAQENKKFDGKSMFRSMTIAIFGRQEISTESPERRALRELLEAIQIQASPGSTYNDGDTRHAVSLLNPYIASAMREADAVLGKKVEK